MRIGKDAAENRKVSSLLKLVLFLVVFSGIELGPAAQPDHLRRTAPRQRQL